MVRGLTEQQIDELGYKSTPPFYLCRKLAGQLLEKGCTLQGVPGFYQKDGHWTVKFYTKTAGILIPVRGIDGLIRGLQIRLDVPIKDEMMIRTNRAPNTSGSPLSESQWAFLPALRFILWEIRWQELYLLRKDF